MIEVFRLALEALVFFVIVLTAAVVRVFPVALAVGITAAAVHFSTQAALPFAVCGGFAAICGAVLLMPAWSDFLGEITESEDHR